MNRRGALLLGVAWVLTRSAPARAACKPSAQLSGDPDKVGEVARALDALGVVAGEADGACPPVVASVLADPEGFAVSIRDPHGRIEGRVVADARTAAAWIESWVDDDAAPLWSAPVTPPMPPALAPPAAAIAPPSETVVAVAPTRRRRWLPAVDVDYARDFASDHSDWTGVSAAACLRVGRFCLGVAGRHVGNDAFSTSNGLTAVNRTATVATATAALPVRIARVEIAPEVALGAGWMSTVRDEPPKPCVDANGTACPGMPLYIGDGFTASTTTMRVSGALAVAVPLSSWLWLDGRLGAEDALGAHTATRTPPPVMPSDPTTNPNQPPPPVPPGDPLLDLPGEPSWTWTAAIGLRAELP